MMEPPHSPYARVLTWCAAAIAIAAGVWLLRALAVLFVPLAIAFFIATLVHPVLSRLGASLPPRVRWAALPLTMALILLVLGGAIWVVAESVDEIVEAAPRYDQRMRSLWQQVKTSAESSGLPLPAGALTSGGVEHRLGDAAASLARSTWNTVSMLVLVVFLVLLMLLEAPDWRRKMEGRRRGDAGLDTVTVVAAKVRQYLFVRTVLGAASAVAAGVWLWALDVDLVLVWIALTFTLNYVPNLGSIIAVIPPSLFAILQHGPVRGLVVLAGLTLFEQIIGNVIDPRMQGRRLEVSPVIVLLSLVFWSWAWGVAGALLAVPMTVAILVGCAHVRGLEWVAELASRGRDGGEGGAKEARAQP